MPPNMLKAKVGGGFHGRRHGRDQARRRRRWKSLKGEFADWAADDVRRLAEAREAYAKKPDAQSRATLAARRP